MLDEICLDHLEVNMCSNIAAIMVQRLEYKCLIDVKRGEESDQRRSASLIGRCNYYNQLGKGAFRIKEELDALLEIAQDFIWFRNG